ncbi:MAG TPA: PKD domain-containing protein, partial [Thermoflexia bacterium]|nr:PKD domain-containing protein [Thermoflexia bacterium]
VTYTLRVTNTGNCTDAFTVTVSGNVWPTALSTTDTGDLASGAGADVVVTVTIPLAAQCGDFDVAIVTVTSHSNPAVGDSSVLTTRTFEPDIEVDPLSLSAVLEPGGQTVRQLTISNAPTATADLNWHLAEAPAATWLRESPGNGTLAPAMSDTVNVTFDATGLSNGTYNTMLRISSNDPDEPVVGVGVTLVVTSCIPVSDATIITPTEPRVNKPATFTATVDPASTTPINYIWDFGDGTPPVESDWVYAHTYVVQHTYTASDTYHVVMTATNCAGASVSIASADVAVLGEPVIGVEPLSLSAVLNLNVGAGQTKPRHLTISNGADATTDLIWRLVEMPTVTWLEEAPTSGVISPSGESSVEVIFNSMGVGPGTHTTTLRVASNDLDDPAVDVDVTLEVVEGCINIKGADFDFAPQGPITAGATLVFTGSVEQGGLPIDYTWDFGDGTPPVVQTDVWAQISVVTHTYTGEEVGYNVRMTVHNCGGEVIVSKRVGGSAVYLPLVLRNYPPCAPVEITALDSDSPVELGETMHFTATAEGTPPIVYNWDFGGAGTRGGTDTNPTFTYEMTGTYTVTLEVENDCGTDTASIMVTVTSPACIPAEITNLEDNNSVVLGEAAYFTATVNGTRPITYTWDFDSDGTPEQIGVGLNVVSHTYTETGPYVVTLDVENACGADQAITAVIVSGGTRADFTFTPTAPPVILPDTWDADERRRW